MEQVEGKNTEGLKLLPLPTNSPACEIKQAKWGAEINETTFSPGIY